MMAVYGWAGLADLGAVVARLPVAGQWPLALLR
jgi:hypothetical protein